MRVFLAWMRLVCIERYDTGSEGKCVTTGGTTRSFLFGYQAGNYYSPTSLGEYAQYSQVVLLYADAGSTVLGSVFTLPPTSPPVTCSLSIVGQLQV